MAIIVAKFLVWLIIGAFAGTLAARIITLRREGLGRWTNIGVGMIGAVVGGFIFYVFGIDLGLGELKISVQDLISAFLGSLLCIIGWWAMRKFAWKKPPAKI